MDVRKYDCDMKNSLISIIVPVYKVEPYLKRCIDSLIAQTYQYIEIILVDDGSPDQCPLMCDEYAKCDTRIKVIHKKNGGLSDARNAGLKMAIGEYVLYVDSDDYIERDSCERLLDGMQSDVDFVVGAIREIRGDKIYYQRHTNIIEGRKYAAKDFIIESIKKNQGYAPAVLNLYRRSFLIENGLFYKVGFCYEDTEMLPRLFLAAKKIVYIDYAFYNYLIREDSIMTSEYTSEKKRMALDNYNRWIELFNSVGDTTLQRFLYGVLIRYYVTTARKMKIIGWRIEGMDFLFSWKYALNKKEKLKVLLFNFFPQLYTKF